MRGQVGHVCQVAAVGDCGGLRRNLSSVGSLIILDIHVYVFVIVRVVCTASGNRLQNYDNNGITLSLVV